MNPTPAGFGTSSCGASREHVHVPYQLHRGREAVHIVQDHAGQRSAANANRRSRLRGCGTTSSVGASADDADQAASGAFASPASVSGTNTSGRSATGARAAPWRSAAARPVSTAAARASDVSALMPHSARHSARSRPASRSNARGLHLLRRRRQLAPRQPERRCNRLDPAEILRPPCGPAPRVHPRASSRQNRPARRWPGTPASTGPRSRPQIRRRRSGRPAVSSQVDRPRRQHVEQGVDRGSAGQLPAQHGQLLAYVDRVAVGWLEKSSGQTSTTSCATADSGEPAPPSSARIASTYTADWVAAAATLRAVGLPVDHRERLDLDDVELALRTGTRSGPAPGTPADRRPRAAAAGGRTASPRRRPPAPPGPAAAGPHVAQLRRGLPPTDSRSSYATSGSASPSSSRSRVSSSAQPLALTCASNTLPRVIANCDCPNRAGKPTYPGELALSTPAASMMARRVQPGIAVSAAIVRALWLRALNVAADAGRARPRSRSSSRLPRCDMTRSRAAEQLVHAAQSELARSAAASRSARSASS